MVTVKNIIDFYGALKEHMSEEQIYELIKFMKEHSHSFSSEVNDFYCNILKEEYFNIVNELLKISHGNDNDLKCFAHDIYLYCKTKFS